jgi:hypothetical protein
LPRRLQHGGATGAHRHVSRLSNDGKVVGKFYTRKQSTSRLRYYLRAAGVAQAAKYCLSGFRPGGHTDVLLATDGDHGVANGLGRWD